MAIGVQHYDDASLKEDLTEVVTNISPTATPFLNAIGKTKATQPLHEYLVDTYDAAAHNAVAEGADATVVDLTQPQRANNVTQIFRRVIQVTGTEMESDQAGMSDPYAYQMKKQSVKVAKDMEESLIAGTAASGSSGVARQLRGVIATITSEKTAHNSGTSLTEDIFNSLVGNVVDNTDEVIDTVYVGKKMKQAVSKFTTNTRQINADEKKLVKPVDIYVSDFGVHKIKFSRYIPANAVLGVNTDTWKLAVLRGVKHEELSKTGDAKKGMLIGEATLEGRAEAGNFYASGFNAAG